MTYVIGLISGTSVDGIDAALVNITGMELDLEIQLLNAATYPYPDSLKTQILEVASGATLSLEQLAKLDDSIAEQFAQAAIAINAGYPTATLIGSHGQTVYHRPLIARQLGYTLQLGRGAVIAQHTGIPTVSNFRVADIAAGGEGAPLVSRVDIYLLAHETRCRCVQNLGGIGNLTYLPPINQQNPQQWEQSIKGWDTGPANILLDLAIQQLTNGQKTYDQDGKFAAAGTPHFDLVHQWMQHPFFHQPPPKSTGRELFGIAFLQQCLSEAKALSPADIMATLTELTIASIVHSYQTFLPQLPDEVLLCGGGSRNQYLKQRLQQQLCEQAGTSIAVLTTDEVGLNADFKEAIAFAILAYWREQGIPGNLPSVTNAKIPVLLGEIHPAYFLP
jgi:anhydro-N-acetylmuramic acid kinase